VKKSTGAFGVGIGAAVAAGLLTTALLQRISHTETIVVATQNLPPYTAITATDVATVTIPTDSGIAGLTANPAMVLGKYLTFPVPKGYPITAESLSASYSYSAFLTQYVEKTGRPGMELAVPVQSATEALVEPGESIALLIANRSNTGAVSVQTIEPVLVLNKLVPASSRGATSLLIFVPEQDYNTVAEAVLANNFTVGLIPQNGSFVAPSSTSLPALTPPPTMSSSSTSVAIQSGTASNPRMAAASNSASVTTNKEAHHGTHA